MVKRLEELHIYRQHTFVRHDERMKSSEFKIQNSKFKKIQFFFRMRGMTTKAFHSVKKNVGGIATFENVV